MQNRCGFGHLDHESGASSRQIVGCANPRKNAIQRADAGRVCRHKAANPREQGDERHLPHISRFTAHVGAGNQEQALLWGQLAVIGGEALDQAFHHRMPPGANL